jgi:hypothetical protein
LCVLAIIPLSAQQQNGSKQNSGTKPATGSEKAEVRVEKFNVKQEFGPQATSKRGEKLTAVTPPDQGNGGKGQGAPDATTRQEFGPTVHGSRKDRSAAANPAASRSRRALRTRKQALRNRISSPEQRKFCGS